MKVLSLFDGISCGMVALERAGIKVEKYTAYEIDENAIKISKYNYPNIEHKGNVFDAIYKPGEYDLLIGGSPCTFWSNAGGSKESHELEAKGDGWDLFLQYVRALNEAKPKWFLYENNISMSLDIEEQITALLKTEPIMINSKAFSAQIRKRFYWTNIPFDKNWVPSAIQFKDIEDINSEKQVRSISEYKDTFKYEKDGKLIKWDTSGKGWYSQQNRARTTDQKWPTVCASRGRDKGYVWLGGDKIRNVTIKELERLQTLPDDYTSILVSRDLREKAIGNGWTVNVIAHILNGINNPTYSSELKDLFEGL